MERLISSEIFAFVVLPLLIFFARIFDVSMQTLRIIFIARSFKLLAATIGFFEVLIWLTAITQIMKNLNNPLCYIAYALGFSTGTYIGIKIENRLSLGKVVVRIFLPGDDQQLINLLTDKGFGLTRINACGTKKEISMIYSILEREKLPVLEKILESYLPEIFYTVEDLRQSRGGYFQKKEEKKFRLKHLFFHKK